MSNDTTFYESYDIDGDTITVINQLDKNPCSDKNIKDSQYQYGGVSVYGKKFTAGVFYRIINSEQSYNTGNDIMLVEHIPGVDHIVNRMIDLTMLGSINFCKH